MFVFIQFAMRKNSIQHNPYLFDNLNIANANVKLATCQLKYSGELFPNVTYDTGDVPRILEDVLEFRYRNYNYNTGTQLQNAQKEEPTNDSMVLELKYRLSQGAGVDYNIYAVVLSEDKFMLKAEGNELVPA